MRRYIRHPTDIPIEYDILEDKAHAAQAISNISLGGFAFASPTPIPIGRHLKVRIPLVQPAFEAHCRVVWCRPDHSHYEVGLAFEAPEDAYRVRMVEQVCHIEHYRRQVLEKEGRRLSGEEAALEWIKKYAEEFPHLDTHVG